MNQTFYPRWLNVALGAWLFISAFIWPHSVSQFYNTWIVGAVIAIVAAASSRVDPLRYVNVALSVWLFIASWALPAVAVGTFWNNLLVSIVVFIAALVPTSPSMRAGQPREQPAAQIRH